MKQAAKAAAEARPQYGAICWRKGKNGAEILLITSRDTGRWVIPKGWPVGGMAPEASAALEAWEEAGVEGRVQAHCIGLYSYDKLLGTRAAPQQQVPCVVAVYPLKVQRLRDDFPEAGQRRRKWFAPKKAAAKVDEPELRALLAKLPEHLADLAG